MIDYYQEMSQILLLMMWLVTNDQGIMLKDITMVYFRPLSMKPYKFVSLELWRALAHLVLGLPAGFGTFGPACTCF